MSVRRIAAPRPGGHPITVLLADDHGVLRDGLRALLGASAEFRVVSAVGDGALAVQEAERLQPSVALVGMTLAGLNGIEVARILAGKAPAVAVILLSEHTAPPVVRRALEAGANGYLTKQGSGEEVLRAVREVAAGRRFLGQGLAERFIDVYRGVQRGGQEVESLTATERNILKLVAEGRSNARAADELGLSPRTVETYRLRMMRKLGVGDLATLVKYAIRHGIVPLD